MHEEEGEEEDTVQVTTSSKHDGMETDTEYFSDAAPIMEPEDEGPTEMTPEETTQPNADEKSKPEEKETKHDVDDVPATAAAAEEQDEEKVEQKPLDVQTGGKKKKKAKKGKKRNAV